MTATAPVDKSTPATDRRRVMLAAGVGTVFEWYDFFLAFVVGLAFLPETRTRDVSA